MRNGDFWDVPGLADRKSCTIVFRQVIKLFYFKPSSTHVTPTFTRAGKASKLLSSTLIILIPPVTVAQAPSQQYLQHKPELCPTCTLEVQISGFVHLMFGQNQNRLLSRSFSDSQLHESLLLLEPKTLKSNPIRSSKLTEVGAHPMIIFLG